MKAFSRKLNICMAIAGLPSNRKAICLSVGGSAWRHSSRYCNRQLSLHMRAKCSNCVTLDGMRYEETCCSKSGKYSNLNNECLSLLIRDGLVQTHERADFFAVNLDGIEFYTDTLWPNRLAYPAELVGSTRTYNLHVGDSTILITFGAHATL